MSVGITSSPDSAAPQSQSQPHRGDLDAGKDEAIAMVGEEAHQIDPDVVGRALRKIDWALLPAMTVGVCYSVGVTNRALSYTDLQIVRASLLRQGALYGTISPRRRHINNLCLGYSGIGCAVWHDN